VPKSHLPCIRKEVAILSRRSSSNLGGTMKVEVNFRIVVVKPLAGVTYAIQRGRGERVPPDRSSESELVFQFPLTLADIDTEPPRLTGKFAQGPPQKRFVYINSGTAAGQWGTNWGRRAKVPLHTLQGSLLREAIERVDDSIIIEASIQGIGKDGGPACASIPLLSEWTIRAAA
jgi:hypothetical protein